MNARGRRGLLRPVAGAHERTQLAKLGYKMASWVEQYDRMIRWYERCAALQTGRVHDVSSDNYVDEVYAFFQNCYHLKDWIKNDPAVAQARDGVEAYVTGSRPLRLAADLCNALKHLNVTRSRSGESPSFGPKHFSLHLGDGVPPTISLKYEVVTANGTEEAFSLASQSVRAWDVFIQTWTLR
jgi:hypothetical protein